MALLRRRAPGQEPHDVDLGPANGRLQPWETLRREIDDSIARAARHQAGVNAHLLGTSLASRYMVR